MNELGGIIPKFGISRFCVRESPNTSDTIKHNLKLHLNPSNVTIIA